MKIEEQNSNSFHNHMNFQYIMPLIVSSVLLVANEPSAYSAGDLNSKNPYGLTSSEEHILKNRQEVQTLDKKVGSVALELSKINENYEGIRSVSEAINAKIAKMDAKFLEYSSQNDANISNLQEQIVALKEYVNESRDLQNANQESIKIALNELSSLIDSINSSYVSKKSFDQLAKSLEVLEQKMNSKSTTAQKSTSNISGAQLLKNAAQAYTSGALEDSKNMYLELIDRRYRPARSSFYVAEIFYKQAQYAQAIAYYKQSISLYDKADYIPTLLYHSGISLSKLKKNVEAKKFFDTLKSSYPNSKEAKSLK